MRCSWRKPDLDRDGIRKPAVSMDKRLAAGFAVLTENFYEIFIKTSAKQRLICYNMSNRLYPYVQPDMTAGRCRRQTKEANRI